MANCPQREAKRRLREKRTGIHSNLIWRRTLEIFQASTIHGRLNTANAIMTVSLCSATDVIQGGRVRRIGSKHHYESKQLQKKLAQCTAGCTVHDVQRHIDTAMPTNELQFATKTAAILSSVKYTKPGVCAQQSHRTAWGGGSLTADAYTGYRHVNLTYSQPCE